MLIDEETMCFDSEYAAKLILNAPQNSPQIEIEFAVLGLFFWACASSGPPKKGPPEAQKTHDKIVEEALLNIAGKKFLSRIERKERKLPAVIEGMKHPEQEVARFI